MGESGAPGCCLGCCGGRRAYSATTVTQTWGGSSRARQVGKRVRHMVHKKSGIGTGVPLTRFLREAQAGFFEHCGEDMQAMTEGNIPPPQLFPNRARITRSGCPHRSLSGVPQCLSSASLHAPLKQHRKNFVEVLRFQFAFKQCFQTCLCFLLGFARNFSTKGREGGNAVSAAGSGGRSRIIADTSGVAAHNLHRWGCLDRAAARCWVSRSRCGRSRRRRRRDCGGNSRRLGWRGRSR